MNLSEIKSWLALGLTPGIGSVTFRRLIERFGSPEAVLSFPIDEIEDLCGIKKEIAKGIFSSDRRELVERELYLAEKYNIRILTLTENLYPVNLKRIHDPPPYIYVRGELQELDRYAIAIVGSRDATHYGKTIAEKLAYDLARKGLTIVSGMARGIDTFAHRGAIAASGRTIAVLGSGIDIIYPPENKQLMEKIAEHGAVITEFPFSTKPEAGNFPSRNRIISGLSLGVVLVEASSESGSLITAKAALEQGREVFAVPGNITSKTSRGTNMLIKDGAKLIEDADDIIAELLPQIKGTIKERGGKDSVEITLSEEEAVIYKYLSSEPVHIDYITRVCGLTSGTVLSVLLDLELRGAVKQLPGKMFVREI
ncbi:MAG: DNA-processing protein DprA [Nitrospirota bacterium]